LDVHEAPGLNRKSTDRLEAGMAVTVEPGIYLANWGGIRIEDLVVVRTTKPEILTRTPRELMVI
jgi:Xaa-Pro aminopeptidase